jgi:hypothetical protein
MSITKRYIEFILENIIDLEIKVLVPEPVDSERQVYWKVGPKVYIDATLEVVEKYTRSVKFKIKFDKYEVERLIFIPIESAPFSIKGKLHNKIEKVVYNTLIEDGRREDIIQMYTDKRSQISERIKTTKTIWDLQQK